MEDIGITIYRHAHQMMFSRAVRRGSEKAAQSLWSIRGYFGEITRQGEAISQNIVSFSGANS
jgi:hypothetical protein